jgi:hypothetical protein
VQGSSLLANQVNGCPFAVALLVRLAPFKTGHKGKQNELLINETFIFTETKSLLGSIYIPTHLEWS